MSRHESRLPGANDANGAGFNFVTGRGTQAWKLQDYDADARVMILPRIDWTDTNGDEYFIAAKRAEYINGVWTFSGVETERRNRVPVALSSNTVAVPELLETPDQIRRERAFPAQSKNLFNQTVQMPIVDILDYLKQHPTDLSPKIRHGWLTQLHGRIASPCTCLVVVLIAIPFGAASGRRNLFVGVASSILICFIYFVLQRLGLASGNVVWLPPWLAAWFPNLSFGIAAIWMLLRVR